MASEREKAKDQYLVLREQALKVEKKYSLVKMLSDILSMLCGGVIIGAIFMATDYVTTPITTRGRILFALGCGVITFIIRYFCAYPEGVSFSILIMNILTPFIEKWTAKEPLGGVK